MLEIRLVPGLEWVIGSELKLNYRKVARMLTMTATYSTVSGPHWNNSHNLSTALTHFL